MVTTSSRTAVLASFLLAAPSFAQDPSPPKPWRLDDALGTPDWLRISGEIQLRYEGYEGQFRAQPNLASSDHYVVNRALLKTEVDFDDVGGVVELIDARQFGAGEGSVINNGIVDPIDFLQAYGEVRFGAEGESRHALKIGRFTSDLGARRLVARNRWRNTINAFTGAEWSYRSRDGASSVKAFWTMPVQRLPVRPADLLDNEAKLDTQDKDDQFWGAFYSIDADADTKVEVYGFALQEYDAQSLRRNLYTPGFRVVRAPKPDAVDFEVEAAVQFGETGPLGTRFDHQAWFHHMLAGYTFDAPWQPRIAVAWDYASGDRDPNDGDDNRFDTLFGVNREFGPIDNYLAVARRNINSPEIRLEVTPSKTVRALVAFREVWLASAKDFAPTGGVRDPSGAAGNHFGEQIDGLLRWDIEPDSLQLELGATYLFAGRFLHDAPNGRGEDVAFFYSQVRWVF